MTTFRQSGSFSTFVASGILRVLAGDPFSFHSIVVGFEVHIRSADGHRRAFLSLFTRSLAVASIVFVSPTNGVLVLDLLGGKLIGRSFNVKSM